jgi:hypothetical protein
MALRQSRSGHRNGQHADRTGGRADSFFVDVGKRHEVFFIPQLGSMIYTMNGMTNQLYLRLTKSTCILACPRITAAADSPA